MRRMTGKWITVVGVGADGLAGLGRAARNAVVEAAILVGGERHLAMVPPDRRKRFAWAGDIDATLAKMAGHAGEPVCVLASGDPSQFGIAKRLIRQFGLDALTIIPAPGAFSLAAARMGWALSDGGVEVLSCHVSPVSILARHVAPDVRLLILSRDGETPSEIAAYLREHGFGQSLVTVLEHLGGTDEAAPERRIERIAETWDSDGDADGDAGGRAGGIAALNVVAVHCLPGADARAWPRSPGLPEDAFQHDGKITKREVRAATLARLSPFPEQVLWDVGAGSGAVGIEWMRAAPGAQTVAFERSLSRCTDIQTNAQNLGVPELTLVKGDAPDVLVKAPLTPDAVFVGGGIAEPGVLDACWAALKPGGRLVANAVTLEAQEILIRYQNEIGGDLIKLAVSRSGPVGAMTALRPLMEVLQLAAVKPTSGG